MKKFFGWLLILAGVPLTIVFGPYTLFYLGRGGFGPIVAIYFTGPLFLVGLACVLLGAYLRNRSIQEESCPRFKNRSTVMTNHTPQPPKRNGYNPLTLEDVQPEQPDPFFRNLDTPAARIVGAALFLFIFSMSGNAAVAAPLVTLVLLACLLFRMTPGERALTAAPLTFSAVRLATQLAGPLGVWQYSLPRATAALNTQWSTGNVWVPLFLATYLFFTSSIASNTGRLVFWYSLGVLLSGLIPGEGYAVVCAILYYTLFFAVLVAIVSDLAPRSTPPRPLTATSTPSRA